MPFLTKGEAVRASRSAWRTGAVAASAIQKAAKAPMTTMFDVFLSHAYEDAEIVAGVKVLLERERLKVYVDWIDDAEVDRTRVTARTAQLLRRRMQHCKQLVFVTTKASPKSKWMPWELVYFDGRHPGHVSILPVVDTDTRRFIGLEYLGLYPAFEMIEFENIGWKFGRLTDPEAGETLADVTRR